MVDTANPTEHPNREAWYAIFGTGHPELKKYQEFNMRLSSPPRCKLCYAPYRGIGKFVMKLQNRGDDRPYYALFCFVLGRMAPASGRLADQSINFAKRSHSQRQPA